MENDGLNRKKGHAIIGFNHGLQCYVKNMALGPQSRQKPRPMALFFVYLSPSGHVFNIAWQAMINTYNIGSSNGLVPSGNKPLPKPMLTQIAVAIWRHYAKMS